MQRGDTLSHIAASVAGADATTPRARSYMLAIYQANPRAFDQNMNLLRTGAVLRIPDAATVSAVSPRDASSEIRRQYAAWRGNTGEAAAPAAQQPGRLKLVTPSEGAAGSTPGASSGEVSALQGRVHDLEGQLAEQKRLLDLKNAELARMQTQLAQKQGTAATPPPAQPPSAVTTPPAATPPAPPPAAEATPPPPAAQTAPPPAEQTAPPAAQPPPVAQNPPVTKPVTETPSSSGGSLFDTIKSFWWVILLLLVAAIVIAALRFLRSRRASEFDDSLGRLAVAGAGSVDSGSGGLGSGGGGARGFSGGDVPMRAAAPPVPESAFLVEESGSHERPRLGSAAAAAPAPRHVASDETISSETAIHLDQGDPLAEADFHMAYGLYDQAADLIRIAISREPARRDLKLKLLEVFFVWGNKEQFLTTARELAQTRGDAAPGEWEKILIMGKQLAPEDQLFTGAGAGTTTGAAAGGVDLDLEGGQSRVDFDLLGEPVPADAPQGVDLDIGSAVGEHDPAESTTNVTDRNAALLENTFSSTTGTTRQMTQRVRDTSATGELEGPTVEQPQLSSGHQPTVRQKVETALRQSSGVEQTAELAIDDLGLDVGSVDTIDELGPAAAGASTPDGPTLVAGLDEHSRKVMEDAQQRATKDDSSSTGAWSFDQDELEAALTQTSLAVPDTSSTSRLAALKGHALDVDVGEATGTHRAAPGGVDWTWTWARPPTRTRPTARLASIWTSARLPCRTPPSPPHRSCPPRISPCRTWSR